MKYLIKTTAFAMFFFASYALFFALTLTVFDRVEDGIGVGHTVHGFPFGYYYSSCFGGHYIWSGLIGNAASGAIVGLVAALGLTHFWLKLRSPEFRAKWYL